MSIRISIIFLLAFNSLTLLSRSIKNDSLRNTLYHQAIKQVEDSSYDEANKKFLKLANMGKVLPDEYCFYFGKSLFNSGHKSQSTAFLHKYLHLQGDSATYYNEAMSILASLSVNARKTPQETKDSTISSENPHHQHQHDLRTKDPCENGDQVICPICKGTGVIITKSSFGNTYQSCPYSNEQGYMKCSQYKEYLKGNLIPYDEADDGQ